MLEEKKRKYENFKEAEQKRELEITSLLERMPKVNVPRGKSSVLLLKSSV